MQKTTNLDLPNSNYPKSLSPNFFIFLSLRFLHLPNTMRNRPPASGGGCSSGVDSFTADELEVADVLRHLPDLVRKSEYARFIPCRWGAKRRRRTAPPPSSDSPELLPATEKLDYDLSNSPNSPLVFCSLADFDSKHAVPNNEFKEAKGLELFTKGDQLRAENIKLQDTRQQQCVNSLELKLFNQSEPLDPPHHQQQESPQLEIIPDLNVPVEVHAGELGGPHHQKMEHHYYQQYNIVAAAKSRAESAALARKRRLIIHKSKKKTTRGRI